MVRIRQLTRKKYVKPRPFVLLSLFIKCCWFFITIALNIKKKNAYWGAKKRRFSTWIPSSRSGISPFFEFHATYFISILPANAARRKSGKSRARKFVPSHARDLPHSSSEHPRSRARLTLLFCSLPQTESLELEQANQFYTNQGACSPYVYSRQMGILQMSWLERDTGLLT